MSGEVLNKEIIIKHFYNVDDTLKLIEKVSNDYSYQVKDLANQLMTKSRSDYEFIKNIFEWVRSNVNYVHDDSKRELQGKKDLNEEVRTPARTIQEGGDCDCMTALIRSILNHYPNITHTSKCTAYKYKKDGIMTTPKRDEYHHVYPVAYLESGEVVPIDCVPEVPYFGWEAPNIINLKFYPKMSLKMLSGIGNIETEDFREAIKGNSLEGVEFNDNDENNFLGKLIISDEPIEELEGDEFQTTVSSLIDQALYADLIKQRETIITEMSNKSNLSLVTDFTMELNLINNIIDKFNISIEERHESLNDAINSNSIFVDYYQAIVDQLNENEESRINGLDETVYVGSLKTFLKKTGAGIKNVAKKLAPKNVIKKTITAVKKVTKKILPLLKKVSPTMVATRGAILTALGTNAGNYSKKLAYGYMTQSEAQSKSLNMTEWQKFQAATKKAEDTWVSKFGGARSAFKNAVMKGRGAKAAGLKGVGEVGSIAAIVVKAIGFVVNVFKGLKLKKVNPKEETDESDAAGLVPDNSETIEEDVETVETTDEPSGSGGSMIKTETTEGGIMGWIKSHKKIVIGTGIGLLLLLIVILVFRFVKKNKKNAAVKKRLAGIRKRKTLKGYVRTEHPAQHLTKVVYDRKSPARRGTVRKRTNKPGAQTRLYLNGLDGKKQNSGLRSHRNKVKAYRKLHPKVSYRNAQKACKGK